MSKTVTRGFKRAAVTRLRLMKRMKCAISKKNNGNIEEAVVKIKVAFKEFEEVHDRHDKHSIVIRYFILIYLYSIAEGVHPKNDVPTTSKETI